MCDTVFTFGQRGGFHFECPSQWKNARLPHAVLTLFQEDKISSVYSMVLGHDNGFFIAYYGKDGSQHIQCEGLPASLRDFLFEKDPSGQLMRHLPGLKVSIGPYNRSFFVSDGKKMRWLNLPSSLEEAFASRRNSNGTWIDAPRLVVLGAQDNYIMVTEGNAASWQLNNYVELRTILRAFRDQGTSFGVVHNVALNPYRFENWILQGRNGTTLGGGLLTHASKAFESIQVAIETDTAATKAADAERVARQVTQIQDITRARAALQSAVMLNSLINLFNTAL